MPRSFLPLLLFFSTLVPLGPSALRAQDEDLVGDNVVMMEAFNVSAYGGKIPIMDGFTGKAYRGNNQVVFDFASTFNKLLLGFHQHLVLEEIKHMKFRIALADQFEQEMRQLTGGFHFEKFTLDRTNWLSRERAIVSRLIKKPFFKINALVAWDLDRLHAMAPEKPKSKYGDDIHFNPTTKQWERRITAKWEVFFHRGGNFNNAFFTDKTQGLNLDTLRGFHFIERGLPSQIPSTAFRNVKLTYPIFYSDNTITEEALRSLQETFVANLYFIYDPFSWVARRDTRFRGGYIQDCRRYIEAARIEVHDRAWFDPVFSRFLSDVVTIKLQGAEEIYSLQMLGQHLNESPRTLGVGLDLLNWNKGENREALEKPAKSVRLSSKNETGFRFLLIDAYQRYGDTLVDRLRTQLLAAAEARQKPNGQALIKSIIADLSGLSFDEFGQRAMTTQTANLMQHQIKP